MSSTLAPGLARKVKKVLDTRLDGRDTVACLKALSEFYVNDTDDDYNNNNNNNNNEQNKNNQNRLSLRKAIELRGLDINNEFIHASDQTQVQLKSVEEKLEQLTQCVDAIEDSLERKSSHTVQLLRETEHAKNDLEKIKSRQKVIDIFMRDYQLKEQELIALKDDSDELLLLTTTTARNEENNKTTVKTTISHNQHQSQSRAITPLFYKALKRVKQIHKNCAHLLRTQHQRSGLELMDVMSGHMDQAHEKLCRWVQSEVRLLAENEFDGDNFSANAEEILADVSKALRVLRSRPTLHQYCVEEIARTRHNALFRHFIAALTRGGQSGKAPIEARAHDPVRYISDMLGWIHQAVANERDVCNALFINNDDDDDDVDDVDDFNLDKDDGENKKETGSIKDEEDSAKNGGEESRNEMSNMDETSKDTVIKIMDGLSRPFRVRVEQALAGTPDALETYKIMGVLHFYAGVLEQLLFSSSSSSSSYAATDVAADSTSSTGLVEAVKVCAKAAQTSFNDDAIVKGAAIKRNPPVPQSGLQAPFIVQERLNVAISILKAASADVPSSSPIESKFSSNGDVGNDLDNKIIKSVLDAIIDPVIEACEQGANKMRELNSTIIGGSKTIPWAADAYVLNCLGALHTPLKQYPLAQAKTQDLTRRISNRATDIADDHAESILSECGLLDVLERVSLYQERSSGVMSHDPSLTLEIIAKALQGLVESAKDGAPDFNEIQSPRVRLDIQNRFSHRLIEAYTRVYIAVLNPNAGYGVNAQDSIKHRPDALSTIFGM
jgi:conserved oligomeric Golgi complex subunit 6